MDEVLLIGCPDSFLAALPDDVRAVQMDHWRADEAACAEPVLVVVGPSMDAPLVAAQRAAQRYSGCGMMIAAPSERCADLVQLLRITPFVPLGTRVVPQDSPGDLQDAVTQILERTKLRIAQKQRLGMAQRALSAASHTPDATVGYDERERLYSSVVESSDDAILSMSLDGIITSWNHAAERLFGFAPEEAVGSPVDIIVPEDRQDEVRYLRTRLLQGESFRNFETVRIDRDGRRIDVSLTLSPVRAGSGAIIGASSIARDMTQRNRAQREILRQAKELEAAREGYQDLYDHAPDIYLSVDAHSRRISNCNETCIRKLGYARDELIGRNVFDIYHPDCHEEVEHAFSIFARRGELANARLLLRSKDGSVMPVLLNLSAARDETGNIAYSRSALRDISDVVELEARQAAILDGALDAIITIDRDGVVVEYNSAAEALFGYEKSEAVGRKLGNLIVPPDLRDAHRIGLARHIATGEARVLGRRLELPAMRKNGEVFPAEISIVRLSGTTQPLFTGFIRDLTELKRTRDDLQSSIAELRRSNRDLEQFAYAASHDLQEPLRMVGAYMQLLERTYGGALDERARTYVRYASDGAERMKGLIDGLLDYSRVDRRNDAFSWVSCAEIVARALEDVGLLLEKTGVEVTCGDLPTVWADGRQMERVFLNLLTNAIKFRREKNARVFICATRPDDSCWEFVVEDNGIGFDERNADRIFQMFQMLHSRRQYEGSGIGLALSRKIVERHGGRIWAESTPGEGSRFHFTIPDGGMRSEVTNERKDDTGNFVRSRDMTAARGSPLEGGKNGEDCE